MGKAIPHKITKHVHPNAATKATTPTAPVATGIEYLKTVATNHQETLAARINYANLPTKSESDPGGGDGGPEDAGVSDPVGEELPGQLDLTDLADDDQGGQS